MSERLDRALLGRLAGVVQRCTEAFEACDHALALELAERFFWFFCDDYLELVKPRAYRASPAGTGPAGAASAAAALRQALSVLLRLFAPFLPFVTEEVWSWSRGEGRWRASDSVHRTGWPQPEPLQAAAGQVSDDVLDAASAAIGAVRKAKSKARLPMRATVAKLVVTGPQACLAALSGVLGDVQAAGAVTEVELRRSGHAELDHDVTL